KDEEGHQRVSPRRVHEQCCAEIADDFVDDDRMAVMLLQDRLGSARYPTRRDHRRNITAEGDSESELSAPNEQTEKRKRDQWPPGARSDRDVPEIGTRSDEQHDATHHRVASPYLAPPRLARRGADRRWCRAGSARDQTADRRQALVLFTQRHDLVLELSKQSA